MKSINKTALALSLFSVLESRQLKKETVKASDLESEYQLIKNKQSKLSANQRKAVVEFYEFSMKQEEKS